MANLDVPAFVGRADELNRLKAALISARAGQPTVVLVDGAAGFGKSALVSELVRSLDGSTLITTTGDEYERELRFGLLEQIMGSRAGPWPDPFAAGASLLGFLGDQAGDSPLILTVDDAHLADVDTLRALSFAIRRLQVDPVLIVLTVRSDEIHLLPTALVSAAAQAGNQIHVGGFTDQEVLELSSVHGGGRLSRRAAARLRAHTDGNPLHAKALLTEVPVERLEAIDQAIPAPKSFAMLVMRDIAQTSATSQRLAAAAAVLGDSVPVPEVQAVADINAAELAAALEELEGIRVLSLAAGGATVDFEHSLVRAAVYGDLRPATRSRLHRRAAEVLTGNPSLRHRIAAAIGPDRDLALDLEADARSQQGLGNLAVAAEEMLAASRLLPAGQDADRLQLDAVELLLMAGDVGTAAAHADRLAAISPSGRRLFVEAWMAWLSGRATDATILGRKAWDLAAELDEHERDVIAAMLAQIEIQREHGSEAAAWAARALEGGGLEPSIAPQTRAAQAIGLSTSGEAEQGLETLAWLPTNPRDVERHNHPELTARGILRNVTGDLAGAEADLSISGSVAHGDFAPFRLIALAGLVETRFLTGDWTGAHAVAEQVLSLGEDMEQYWLTGFLHAEASYVPSGRGDWTSAQAHVDAAQAAAHALDDLATAAYADDAAIFLATCEAKPGDVLVLADRLRRRPQTTPHEPGMFSWPVHLASALVDLGRLDEAETELAAMKELAELRHCRRRLAAIARVRGQLYAARRQVDRARDSFVEALQLGDGNADALEHAVAYEAYGRFLRRRGERRSAIEELLQARSQFIALGAAPFLQRCDDELAACGVAGPDTSPARDSLTPQERAVAMLVCEGRTNREVADELVLSTKTVGYHLANVYSKLGVHSRVQLLKAWAEQTV